MNSSEQPSKIDQPGRLFSNQMEFKPLTLREMGSDKKMRTRVQPNRTPRVFYGRTYDLNGRVSDEDKLPKSSSIPLLDTHSAKAQNTNATHPTETTILSRTTSKTGDVRFLVSTVTEIGRKECNVSLAEVVKLVSARQLEEFENSQFVKASAGEEQRELVIKNQHESSRKRHEDRNTAASPLDILTKASTSTTRHHASVKGSSRETKSKDDAGHNHSWSNHRAVDDPRPISPERARFSSASHYSPAHPPNNTEQGKKALFCSSIKR